MRWIVRLFIGKLVLGGAWAAPAVLESGNITTPAASAAPAPTPKKVTRAGA